MTGDEINALESESGIIATLIHKPEFCFSSESLLPNYFSDRYNRCIYVAITELANRGIKTIDAFNIFEILTSMESLKRAASDITVDRLQELVDISGVLARNSIEEYKLLVNNVVDAAFRRSAFSTLRECEAMCFDKSVTDLSSKIYSAVDNTLLDFATTSDLPEYKDVVDAEWAKTEARQRGEMPAIEFPFPLLNNYVVMEPGEVVCFTGDAKTGKSSMLMTIAVDLLKKDKGVLYIDSELSTRLWTVRLIAHLTGIPFGRLRSGNYSEEERGQIKETIAWIKTRRLIHTYMPVLDGNAMYTIAKKAKHLIDIDVIIVDYLKADSSKDNAYEVYANLGNTADILKNKIAGDMDICGLTAAQATSTGKIADSARVARSMSTVVAIGNLPAEQQADNPPPNGIKKKTLRVVYNRNGETMTENEWIDLDFSGATLKYMQSPVQHSTEEPY